MRLFSGFFSPIFCAASVALIRLKVIPALRLISCADRLLGAKSRTFWLVLKRTSFFAGKSENKAQEFPQ